MRRGTAYMLGFSLLAGFLAWLTVAVPLAAQRGNRAADDRSARDSPFALVELFTSQGCSSCPPADAVLRRLESQRQQDRSRIYSLSFHVDYWNRLGWRDPYSQPEFSARQRRYAAALGSDRVYTPQAIINGVHDVVGSRESVLRRILSGVLQRPTSTRLDLDVRRDGREVTVTHRATTAPGHTRTHVAWVETGIANDVPRGENRGRTLRHDNVVRELQTRSNAGTVRFTIPEDVAVQRTAVVAFVQDPRTMAVLGANRAPIE